MNHIRMIEAGVLLIALALTFISGFVYLAAGYTKSNNLGWISKPKPLYVTTGISWLTLIALILFA